MRVAALVVTVVCVAALAALVGPGDDAGVAPGPRAAAPPPALPPGLRFPAPAPRPAPVEPPGAHLDPEFARGPHPCVVEAAPDAAPGYAGRLDRAVCVRERPGSPPSP